MAELSSCLWSSCSPSWARLMPALSPRPFGVKVMLLVCGIAALSCDCHGVVVKNELGVQSSGGQQLWLRVPIASPFQV